MDVFGYSGFAPEIYTGLYNDTMVVSGTGFQTTNAVILFPSGYERLNESVSYLSVEDRPGYLESHRKRLDTLEKNGIVKDIGHGRYEVPADLIAQG